MKITMQIIFGILLISNFLLAQKVDPAEYKIQKNQLEEKRDDLLREQASLKKEIDGMYKKIEELDTAIKEAIPKYLIKKYEKKEGGNLALGKIWKGMTKDMMLDIWGKPDKINTDKFSYGVFTQFYYGKITYFFRDGKLIDWEEVK